MTGLVVKSTHWVQVLPGLPVLSTSSTWKENSHTHSIAGADGHFKQKYYSVLISFNGVFTDFALDLVFSCFSSEL